MSEKMREALEIVKTRFENEYDFPETLDTYKIIRDALKAEPDLELSASKTLELPAEIKKQHLKVEDISFKIEDLEHDLDILKNRVLDEIVSEKDGDKLKYTNEQARRVAVKKKLDESNEYHVLIDDLKVQKRVLATERIELEYLNNLFKAHKAVWGGL